MGNWVLDEVERIIALQNAERSNAEEVGSAYYELAKGIVMIKVPDYDSTGNHSIACITNALDKAHSVEELEVIAKLYTSDPICGLLADPYAADLSNNTQMVEGIIKVMDRHTEVDKLRIFAQILHRFCRDWYVGRTEMDTEKVCAAIGSVTIKCPEIANEMPGILNLVKHRSTPKVRPEPPEIPRLTLRQRIFGI